MKKPFVSEGGKDFLLSAMALGVGGAVENQEARGQRSFVESETLPADGDKFPLQVAGVKFIGPVEGDEIFQYVELPKGWKKQPTDHSMWSDLLDDKGRKRAAIFYKAAFYDRSAHFSCNTRFSLHEDYNAKHFSVVHVRDGEIVIHSTEPLPHLVGDDRETNLKNYALDDQAIKSATEWLEAQYPDWKNPAAYWD